MHVYTCIYTHTHVCTVNTHTNSHTHTHDYCLCTKGFCSRNQIQAHFCRIMIMVFRRFHEQLAKRPLLMEFTVLLFPANYQSAGGNVMRKTENDQSSQHLWFPIRDHSLGDDEAAFTANAPEHGLEVAIRRFRWIRLLRLQFRATTLEKIQSKS